MVLPGSGEREGSRQQSPVKHYIEDIEAQGPMAGWLYVQLGPGPTKANLWVLNSARPFEWPR